MASLPDLSLERLELAVFLKIVQCVEQGFGNALLYFVHRISLFQHRLHHSIDPFGTQHGCNNRGIKPGPLRV